MLQPIQLYSLGCRCRCYTLVQPSLIPSPVCRNVQDSMAMPSSALHYHQVLSKPVQISVPQEWTHIYPTEFAPRLNSFRMLVSIMAKPDVTCPCTCNILLQSFSIPHTTLSGEPIAHVLGNIWDPQPSLLKPSLLLKCCARLVLCPPTRVPSSWYTTLNIHNIQAIQSSTSLVHQHTRLPC